MQKRLDFRVVIILVLAAAVLVLSMVDINNDVHEHSASKSHTSAQQ